MLNSEKPRISIKNDDKPPKPVRNVILWEHMTPADLLSAYEDLRAFLPATALKDMNVEEELMLQYQTLKIAQRDALDDPETTTSAKATISNSVSSTLARIAALQNDTYTSERFKNIETALIRLLNKWPEDQVKTFLEDYKRVVGK